MTRRPLLATRRVQRYCVVLIAYVAVAGTARAADLFPSIEKAFAVRGLEHAGVAHAVRGGGSAREADFLGPLFEIIDDAILLNANVSLWFSTDGERGRHPAGYADDLSQVVRRIASSDAPPRAEPFRDYLAETLRLQAQFVEDRFAALEAGKEFESQLSNPFAYHEGLHRSDRTLLKAFAEFRATFPDVGGEAMTAIRTHLNALRLK